MSTVVFDIETAEAESLDTYGPGFVRLCGWQHVTSRGEPLGPIEQSTDPSRLISVLNAADFITGHNIIAFDIRALAKWWGADYAALCAKAFDTIIVERHLNPVAAKGAQPTGFYGLDQTSARYGVGGKSHVDFAEKIEIIRRIQGDKKADAALRTEQRKQAKCAETGAEYREPASEGVLRLLARLYGGFGEIPQDDPDYRHYLDLDIDASRGVYAAHVAAVAREELSSRRYLKREHAITAALDESVTLTGMRVDMDFTMREWSKGQARLEASKQMLHEKHGMPLDGKKPHTTNPGKAAFRAAIRACDISEDALRRNWKHNSDGSLSTGKDILVPLIEVFDRTRPQAAELCRTILAMNGERTVYGTVLDNAVNGRVHPYIGPDQSSGRWSMKNPGLTVLGKRGGKARERAMMLADEGDVLVAIDADQIDARMIAALSQDPAYMANFGPGIDLHSEVAFRVWSNMDLHGPDCHQLDEWHDHGCGVRNKCHCEYRDRAKVFGHGWNYGMGPNSMARNHGVDVEVAHQFDRGMQEAFPVLCQWKEEVRQAAGVLGFGEEAPANDSYRILHTVFGRPVRVERNRAYTQACAQLGQGSTRDGMAEAILNLPRDIQRRIRAVVHDEIVVSIPAGDDAQERAQAIADSMAYDIRGVTISFGCSRVARSWAGCYGEQYEAAA